MHVVCIYSIPSGILQLYLSLHLLLQSFRVSCESLGRSKVFPDQAQMSLYACGLHDPPEYGGDFNAPYRTSYFSTLLFKLLVSLLFSPTVKTVTHCLRQP